MFGLQKTRGKKRSCDRVLYYVKGPAKTPFVSVRGGTRSSERGWFVPARFILNVRSFLT